MSEQPQNAARRDFYGVAITINEDGSDTVEYCGGYHPRPLTAEELRPWLDLIDSRFAAECDSSCVAL